MSAAVPTAGATDLGHLAGTPAHRRVLVALFAAGLATFALLYSTQALLPELSADLDVGSGASTLSLSVATIGLGLALLVAGPLSEVVGRTRLIHTSMIAASVIGVLCALAPSWPVLLGLRGLQGVALAGLPAVATAYLREELDPSTHARAAGLYVGGTAIGGMAGRLVTGAVGEVAGWRAALAATALVALACALVVWLLLPASRHFTPTTPSVRAMGSMARRALSDPALLRLYVIGACGVGSLVAVLNTLGFRLAGPPFGFGLAAASLVFCVYPLGSLASVAAGSAADRWGRRAVLPLGSLVALVGVALTLSGHLSLVVVGLALLTMGFFAAHAVASGWVPARAHAGGVATAQAASFYLFSFYLGSSLFGSLAGHAWSVGGWPAVALLSAALVGVTGLTGLSLRRTPTLLT